MERNDNGDERFKFTGKEQDAETGFNYFGARYYDAGVSVWLSVDPYASKYPTLSPYAYVASNPIKLIDPDGRKIEYSSFKDKLLVGIARVISKRFRKDFKELRASDETYVFKVNDNTNDELTTDGDKLYINYSTNRISSQGDNWYTNLKHETEHAMQFEYGEIGFDNNGRTTTETEIKYISQFSGNKRMQIPIEIEIPRPDWNSSGVNADLNDEVNARDAGYITSFSLGGDYNKNVKMSWRNPSVNKSDKIQHLQNSTTSYSSWPVGPVNNTNTVIIKNSTQYMLPHRARP